MKQETKETLLDILFFFIGFIGFQLLWYFILLPMIVK